MLRSIGGWPRGLPLHRSTRSPEADPLRRDLLTLRRASETAVLVLTEFPGLAEDYARLAAATAMARPHRPLPRIEQDMEQIVLALLGADTPPVGRLWPAMMGTGPLPDKAPPGYRSILPCPLWGDCWTRELSPAHAGDDECVPTAAPAPAGRSQAFRRPRARGRYAIAAIPSCSTALRRSSPWPR